MINIIIVNYKIDNLIIMVAMVFTGDDHMLGLHCT